MDLGLKRGGGTETREKAEMGSDPLVSHTEVQQPEAPRPLWFSALENHYASSRGRALLRQWHRRALLSLIDPPPGAVLPGRDDVLSGLTKINRCVGCEREGEQAVSMLVCLQGGEWSAGTWAHVWSWGPGVA